MAEQTLREMEEKMTKAIERLKNELGTIRTGSANPSVFNNLMVEYYGTPTPFNQVAQVSAPDAHLLVVSPYDKSALAAIEQAIVKANMGFNPTNDGTVIRVAVPQLTTETRKELAKKVKSIGEDAKVAIRNVRRDANDAIKKMTLPEDEAKGLQSDIQEQTDKFIKRIDEAAAEKEKNIMTL